VTGRPWLVRPQGRRIPAQPCSSKPRSSADDPRDFRRDVRRSGRALHYQPLRTSF
jgi:hypothetical protein